MNVVPQKSIAPMRSIRPASRLETARRPRPWLGLIMTPLVLVGLGACAGASPGPPADTPPAAASPPTAAAPPAAGARLPADGPRVVQPGAPGTDSRAYGAGSLEEVEGVSWTEADVAFMQGMIHHHAQALQMTSLIDDRTESVAIRQMGLRMAISQADEIAIMERWLQNRAQEVPEWRAVLDGVADEHAGHGGMDHTAHGAAPHATMPGMLTPEQLARLEAERGEAFDRLFLELMIQHHEGAIIMVRDLFAAPGAGQESQVYQIASEIDADQAIEIRRMQELLATGR